MLAIRFSVKDDQVHRPLLATPSVGERHGQFAPPFGPATWAAIIQALEPGFVLEEDDEGIQAALEPLGPTGQLHRTVGTSLADALLATDDIGAGCDAALTLAEGQRQPLPVGLHFGQGCDALAGLPWELLHHRDHFLVANTSIALSRYPEGTTPPTPALTHLRLRVFLVLPEPVDVSPVLSRRARDELLHGLCALDEGGAVIVDPLRPSTYVALEEAVGTGSYQLLVLWGACHDGANSVLLGCPDSWVQFSHNGLRRRADHVL